MGFLRFFHHKRQQTHFGFCQRNDGFIGKNRVFIFRIRQISMFQNLALRLLSPLISALLKRAFTRIKSTVGRNGLVR